MSARITHFNIIIGIHTMTSRHGKRSMSSVLQKEDLTLGRSSYPIFMLKIKLDDLMQLLSNVPPIHHDFFQQLVGKELDIDSSEAEVRK